MITLKIKDLSAQEIDRVLEMACENLTPFEVIEAQFGLGEADIIKLMKLGMKQSSGEISRKHINKVSGKSQYVEAWIQEQASGIKISKH